MTKITATAFAAILLALPAAAQVATPPLIGGGAASTPGWAIDVDDDGFTRVPGPERARWTLDFDDDGVRRVEAPANPLWTMDVDDDGLTRMEMPGDR